MQNNRIDPNYSPVTTLNAEEEILHIFANILEEQHEYHFSADLKTIKIVKETFVQGTFLNSFEKIQPKKEETLSVFGKIINYFSAISSGKITVNVKNAYKVTYPDDPDGKPILEYHKGTISNEDIDSGEFVYADIKDGKLIFDERYEPLLHHGCMMNGTFYSYKNIKFLKSADYEAFIRDVANQIKIQDGKKKDDEKKNELDHRNFKPLEIRADKIRAKVEVPGDEESQNEVPADVHSEKRELEKIIDKEISQKEIAEEKAKKLQELIKDHIKEDVEAIESHGEIRNFESRHHQFKQLNYAAA